MPEICRRATENINRVLEDLHKEHPETKGLSWQSGDGSIEAEVLSSRVLIPTDDTTKIYYIIMHIQSVTCAGPG